MTEPTEPTLAAPEAEVPEPSAEAVEAEKPKKRKRAAPSDELVAVALTNPTVHVVRKLVNRNVRRGAEELAKRRAVMALRSERLEAKFLRAKVEELHIVRAQEALVRPLYELPKKKKAEKKTSSSDETVPEDEGEAKAEAEAKPAAKEEKPKKKAKKADGEEGEPKKKKKRAASSKAAADAPGVVVAEKGEPATISPDALAEQLEEDLAEAE